MLESCVKKKWLWSWFLAGFFLFLTGGWQGQVQAQSIEEKKAGLGGVGSDLDTESGAVLETINQELQDKRERLSSLQKEIWRQHQLGRPVQESSSLMKELRAVRNDIIQLQQQWRQRLQKLGREEAYALWHQPETTLEQLVNDYGAYDHVYLIPPEVAYIKVSVLSNLPIPRESWGELLELILAHNGVAIRQLGPFLRELYLAKDEREGIEVITNKVSDLSLIPAHSQLCFVLRPEFEDASRVYQILDKFVRRSLTTLQLIGQDIYVVGRAEDIREVLKIYDFVRQSHGDHRYKLVSLNTGHAEDMAAMLEMMFQSRLVLRDNRSLTRDRIPNDSEETGSLKVLSLKNAGQALFLYGTPRQVERAEKVIVELQSQLAGAKEKAIFWYACKHSEAEDIAKVLDKVYALLKTEKLQGSDDESDVTATAETSVTMNTLQDLHHGHGEHHSDDHHHHDLDPYGGGYSITINPHRTDPAHREADKPDERRKNFIVDAKTSSIIMVVEPEHLERIKDLLRKIDVPKKMVQLDIIVFEKSFRDTTEYGLHLLKLGASATNTGNNSAINFNDRPTIATAAGILDFIYSQSTSSSFPAVDLTYRFISTQEDITINANPTVTTINRTPAVLRIVQESSVNRGTVTDRDSNTEDTSFVRAQYGINIEVTPTIHEQDDNMDCCEEFASYVTLDTNINFDTVRSNIDDRPVVDRRNIKNNVRIADGQTLILGGLRRKDQEDQVAAVPLLGEIPGFGKLFSHTQLVDQTREIFIFITPTIISDQWDEICCIKRRELCRRPGDSVEFVERLKCALEYERQCRVVGAMKMLFGRTNEAPCCNPEVWGEYDGS